MLDLSKLEVKALVSLALRGEVLPISELKKICRSGRDYYIRKLELKGLVKIVRHEYTGGYTFVALSRNGKKFAKALLNIVSQSAM